MHTLIHTLTHIHILIHTHLKLCTASCFSCVFFSLCLPFLMLQFHVTLYFLFVFFHSLFFDTSVWMALQEASGDHGSLRSCLPPHLSYLWKLCSCLCCLNCSPMRVESRSLPFPPLGQAALPLVLMLSALALSFSSWYMLILLRVICYILYEACLS